MDDAPAPLIAADTPLRDLRAQQAQLASRAEIFPDARTAWEAVTALIAVRQALAARGGEA